jgi:hypothetical protein
MNTNNLYEPIISRLMEFYGNEPSVAVEIVEQVISNIPSIIEELTSISSELNNKLLVEKLHYHGPSFTYAGVSNITILMSKAEMQFNSEPITDANDPIIIEILAQLINIQTQLTEVVEELKVLN